MGRQRRLSVPTLKQLSSAECEASQKITALAQRGRLCLEHRIFGTIAAFIQNPMRNLTTALSHARSLRVIGQCLQQLAIDRFDLDKVGPLYIVSTSAEDSRKNTHGAPHLVISFDDTRIRQLETLERAKRARSDVMPDVRELSSNMRVLGHYLERKGVTDFTLSWSGDLVKLHVPSQETRSLSIHQNLYDLGVCMYLRRLEQTSAPLSSTPHVHARLA